MRGRAWGGREGRRDGGYKSPHKHIWRKVEEGRGKG